MLTWTSGKGDSDSWLVEGQVGAATVEIRVDVPPEARKKSTP